MHVWPALDIPWGTALPNTVSAVYSRYGGAFIGCCGRAGQVVCGGCCGFAAFWSVPVEEVLLANQSASRALPMCVASSEHAMGHSKAKCSLCSVQQVWWSLHWVLKQGWAAGLWGLQFSPRFPEFFS